MVGKLQRRTIFGVHSDKLNKHPVVLKKRWSNSELSILKREFRYGTPLKVIAQMLGRTESSINKVLSRSGIRHDFNSETPVLPIPDIIQIISYLKTKHYKVTHAIQMFQKCDGNYVEVHNYKVNDIPVSHTRLLIIANKLRIEEGLPIFKLSLDDVQTDGILGL